MGGSFDCSRIKHHPDKRLLHDIKQYFHTFVTNDFDAMKTLQTPDYHMTDIPICVIRATREDWFNDNKNFVSLLTDINVTALTLTGSSTPGSISNMEHLVTFTLTMDPPPGPAANLPPGAKKGDACGMINISILTWDGMGKVSSELEYGRITWKDFDLKGFDAKQALRASL